jgi:hypothetical protein
MQRPTLLVHFKVASPALIKIASSTAASTKLSSNNNNNNNKAIPQQQQTAGKTIKQEEKPVNNKINLVKQEKNASRKFIYMNLLGEWLKKTDVFFLFLPLFFSKL